VANSRRYFYFLASVAVVVASTATAPPARAIFWNNDPAHGVTSASGLTDRVDWFQNVHTINNTSNNTFGTTTLLDSEWAITVRHVVQNGGNYGQITAPENVYVNVFGTRYYADQIFTPDGGSEMALVHLRGGVNGALDARGTINSSFDDAGRLVHVGGYGHRGYFGSTSSQGAGSFRRAYNFPYVAGNGQLRIIADGESQLSANGLLEGTVGSGDSGGPMWAFYGRGFDVENATLDDWRLVGLTATGSGGSNGEPWGGSSNYTRVANYANWINNTLNSLPAPGPATTDAWVQDSGSGLYDSGGDKFSVTGPNAEPAVRASFGPDGAGYTLDSIGDRLSMTAIVDTTLPLGNTQMRIGMFDDAGGTIPGDVSGGTPWNGYFVSSASEGRGQGLFEKGTNGGGIGQWWSMNSPNTALSVGGAVVPTGAFDDAVGIQLMPAGRYTVALDYTREAEGLRIDWSTVQIGAGGQPNGVYEHSGSVLDTSPAADSWNYNQLGFYLYSGAFTGSIIVDDVEVMFDPSILPGDYNGDGAVDAADYTVWRDTFGQMGSGLAADGDNSGTVDELDYDVWKNGFGVGGAGALEGFVRVPEPAAIWLLVGGIMTCLGKRFRCDFLATLRCERVQPLAVALVATCALLLATNASAAVLSSKRGFADTGAGHYNLQATGAGWYYTWGTGVGNPDNFDANHYPMFWSTPGQNTINDVKSRNPEYVLGFNEPERPDQANLSVSQAINSWTNISNSFTGTSTKLVSPAVADTGEGQAWLSSFMQQASANNLKVDAVGFHWYGVSNPNNPAGAASSFLSRVDSYHNQYNKPVFITEFAIHDWGGNYSDEAIIEANRQFINIVIPELESRSYVAGYSWYHWFNDAHLYDGSPAKPTPMAYNYVGAVGSGQAENIAGRDYGEHVAYLTGGDLTKNGSAASQLRYVNALAGASTISGNADWALESTNWVRIQPDATLRKSGANTITIPTGGSVTNNGLLEVSEGRLEIGSPVVGAGKVRISGGGTLAMFGASTLSTSPKVEVRSGGVLDLTGMPRGLNLFEGQTLDNAPGGTVAGLVNALGGTLVTGGGNFAGNLAARSGAIVRVGGDAAGVATRYLVDNFESYNTGDVRSVASPPWTAHQDTSLADVESYSGNKVLTYGWSSDFRGASRNLPDANIIENDESATFFFRINSKTDDPDHNFGLGDRASTGAADFGDYEAQLRMTQGSSAGAFALDARSGSSFSALANGLALNTWYNIWMVVDQSTDTFDLYMNTGAVDATAANKLNASPLSFRNGTASALNTILGLGAPAPIDNAVRIDDLFYFEGFDLTNPLAGFDPGVVWSAETMTIDGTFSLMEGATLQIDLGGAAAGEFDMLEVGGTADLAGELHVSLANGFTPSPGDLFPVLNAADVSGMPSLDGEAGFSLVNTAEGLSLYFGDLPAGDYDRNGTVDAADYALWRSTYGQATTSAGAGADGNGDAIVDAADYTIWRDNVGASIFSGDGAWQTSARVPEPTTLASLIIGAALVVSHARRRGRVH
jgi:hypothetical protein